MASVARFNFPPHNALGSHPALATLSHSIAAVHPLNNSRNASFTSATPMIAPVSSVATPQSHAQTSQPPPFKGAQQSHPQLLILRQASPSEEKVSSTNSLNNVHVVVKNAPFIMQVAVTPNVAFNRVINLNHLAFDAVLLYDTDAPFEKTVDFVKVKPVEHRAKITEHGDSASVEIRIKVLTSQHENSYFRVRLSVINPSSGELYHAGLVAFSDPIKVISKPEQIKKKQPSKKRTLNDTVSETISRIEDQQSEQQRLIEKLLEQQKKNQQNLDTCFSLDALTTDFTGPNSASSAGCLGKEEKMEIKATNFEFAFTHFLNVFNSLLPEEKPTKIRKIIRNSTTQDTEKISELLHGLASQATPRGVSAGNAATSLRSTSNCGCKQCPYQKELERIDEFYKDFLSAPLSDGSIEIR